MKYIPLTGKRGLGKFAIVDDEDFERLSKFKWYLHKYGYPQTTVHQRLAYYEYKNRSIRMHEEVISVPIGYEVDHKDGNKLDNRRANLRKATRAENSRNRDQRKEGGFKGVYWQKASHKWWALITVDYKRISLGTYRSSLHAARAYNEAAIRYHGEFARLNDLSDFNDCT